VGGVDFAGGYFGQPGGEELVVVATDQSYRDAAIVRKVALEVTRGRDARESASKVQDARERPSHHVVHG
jgi:hypothetical protein